MFIDSFAPNPDAVEKHSIAIAASPAVVYRALWSADFGCPVIKLLLGLRSLPGFLARGFRPLPQSQKITLETVLDSGFGVLAEEPGKEIVLGVTGKFWRPVGNLSPFKREDFEKPVSEGLARAIWNFSVNEADDGRAILSTETRIMCGDATSLRKFRIYWLFVRPFSGLIRRIMLRNVRNAVNTD